MPLNHIIQIPHAKSAIALVPFQDAKMLQMALNKFSLEKHPSDMTMVESLTVNNEGARYSNRAYQYNKNNGWSL